MSRRKAPEPTAIDALRPRGAALWKTLGQTEGSSAGAIALEACRIADRLEDLDAIIAGKGVLELLQFRLRLELADLIDEHPDINIKIEISNVLAESRQQAMAMKNLLVELGLKATPALPTRPAATNPLDQLQARRDGKAVGK